MFKTIRAVIAVIALSTLGFNAPAFANDTTAPITTPDGVVRAHDPKPASLGHQAALIKHSTSMNAAAPFTADSAPIHATLSGQVTVDGHIYFGTTSTPAVGVSVQFCEVDANDTLGGQCYSGYTNSSGELAQDAEHPAQPLYLPENIDWRMKVQNFNNSHYAISYIPTPASGTVCAQSASDGCNFSTLAVAVTGVDAVLPAASVVSGVVANDGAAPIAGITVYLDLFASAAFTEYEQTTTAANGSYTFGGVPSGQYAIEYVDTGDNYAYQAFDDESVFYQPDLITTTGGTDLPGVNAHLHLPGAISGTVTHPGASAADWGSDLNSSPLTGEIEVLDGGSNSWVDTGYGVFIAQSGAYTLPDLAPDTYRVRFDYSGSSSNRGATFVGPPVVVTAGHTTTYNSTINVTGLNSTDSALDSISGSAAGVSVSGWAVWPASDATSVGVAITVGTVKTSLTAHKPSPEAVADEASFATVGPNHGFSTTIAVAPGSYNVCISVAEPTGPSASIGCSTVVVPTVHPAVVHQESVKGGIDSLTVKGWDVFPDSLSTQVAMSIHIGTTKYNMTANKSDAEGTAAYPASTVAHGYKHTVTSLAPGSYSVCIWTSEPAGPSINAGCHTATVTGP